jgi:uncharacterized membrane protein
MTANAIRFALLLVLALLVGAMFGILAGYDPRSLSASAFVEQHQNAVRGLNVLLPVMGAVCILLTVVLAVMAKGDTRARYLLAAAAVCLIAAGLVTRFGNQPINAVVMTWSPQSPPANWMALRDAWWRWHIVRTLAGFAGLVLVLLAVLGRRGTAD